MFRINVNRLFIFSAFLVLLCGCSTMETVTKPENKRTLVLDKPLNESYRIILGQLQKCLTPSFTGTLYPDNQTARIFITNGGMVGDVHDLKGLDGDKTELNYYKDLCLFCTDAGADQHILKVNKWVNENSVGCYLSNP